MEKITPVILSGGSGTRLWPMSRPEQPKQFLPLTGAQTMFEMTLARVKDSAKFGAPVIVANRSHRDLIEEQLNKAGITHAKLLLEPCARNTAPAIALAALACETPDTAMLIMPSDHVVADVPSFHAAIAAALPLADKGWLMTFGIEPTAPETGYGYIKMGKALADGVQEVERFIEKPELAVAQAMLDAGDHAWNGGIFLLRADAYLAAMEQHAPDMLAACKTAWVQAEQDDNTVLPDEKSFAACPADSIDYAIMEKTDKVAVAPVSMGWSDVGSWDALAEISPSDDSATSIDSNGNFVKSDGVHINLAGVENMIVIASGNDVLIVPRSQSQRVKQVAEAQKKSR